MHRSCYVMFAGIFSIALPAHGASLRILTTLKAPAVRISDLFDDAGPNAALVLGPSPAPGARIVVEAPQLAAIARQFGVDWHPVSTADRAVLDRPGRFLARDDVIVALRAALAEAGAPADADIQLSGFTPPLVAPESHPQAVIEQINYDPATGHFGGLLEIAGGDTPNTSIHLSGSLAAMIEVPVPSHNLSLGSVVGADDIRTARVHVESALGEVARNAEQIVGLETKRSLSAGHPVALAALARPFAVRGGARVTMELEEAGIHLVAAGNALNSAGIGERVRVINPTSRAVVEADVIGPARVRVTPGSLPVTSPAARTVQASGSGSAANLQ